MPKHLQKNYFLLLLILVAFSVTYLWHQSNIKPQVKGEKSSDFHNQLIIDFFDVGQGDAALIRTASGQDILVDGGPDNKILEKLGKYLPIGDNDLELVILSHAHSDHVAGLVAVLDRYNVKKILMTKVDHKADDFQNFLKLIKEKNIEVKIASSTETIIVDASTSIDLLWPLKDIVDRQFDNLNNTSIVFRLTYVSSTVLFTGDNESEEKLTTSTNVKSQLLKVGHHGSTNANDQLFLNQVDPDDAVIEVGAKNQFDHPHYRTLYYLEKLGAKIWRTDLQGDIIFVSNGYEWQKID